MNSIKNYLEERIAELEEMRVRNEDDIQNLRKKNLTTSYIYEIALERRQIIDARMDEVQFILAGIRNGVMY